MNDSTKTLQKIDRKDLAAVAGGDDVIGPIEQPVNPSQPQPVDGPIDQPQPVGPVDQPQPIG